MTTRRAVRAIKIDPVKREVVEILVVPELDDLKVAIGCDWVEIVRFGGGVVGVIDEEGRINGRHAHGWIPVAWGREPLMGTTIVLREDHVGGLIDLPPGISVDSILAVVGGWFEGEPPPGKIETFTVGSLCSMCGQRPLEHDDLLSGRPLCARCRDGLGGRRP